MPPIVADPSKLLIILVDLQSHFLKTVHGNTAPAIARIQQLLLMSDVLKIPVLVTLEEPTARKGQLTEQLTDWLPDSATVLTKLSYDLCGEPAIRQYLQESHRSQCMVAGAETDVCVLHSVLGLRGMDLDVFVMEDGLFTSSPDSSAALARMAGSGAIPVTWKSLYYELLRTDDVDNRLRADPTLADRNYVPPEELPE